MSPIDNPPSLLGHLPLVLDTNFDLPFSLEEAFQLSFIRMHRPRLFQTFSRSRQQQQVPGNRYGASEEEYYNHYTSGSGGEQTSAWRKVLSRKPREEHRPVWEEEVIEYPSRSASYLGPDVYSTMPGRRPPMDTYYPDEHEYAGEHYDLDQSTVGDPVPIVQRENSLSRMRDMFADHGRASHAVTEIPLPTSTNRITVTDMQSPVEVHNRHPSWHQPIVIGNTTTQSVRPDMEHAQVLSDRARSKRPEYRREYSPESTHSDSYENEYPPCVVVVERGRHGKPDTYYIIPGGAPVIFEDENGRELTRVGDFSGRYRPHPPRRPVIIQDENGREIYRMGFDSSSSSKTRPEYDHYPSRRRYHDRYHDSQFHYDRRSPSDSSSRTRHYADHYSRRSGSRHGSPKVYVSEEYSEYHDRHSSSRSDVSSKSSPKVVYIDPSVQSGSDHSRGRSSRTYGSSSHRQDYDHRTPHPSPVSDPRPMAHSPHRSTSESTSSGKYSDNTSNLRHSRHGNH